MRRFYSAVLEANWRNKTNNTLRKVVKTELQNSVYFFWKGGQFVRGHLVLWKDLPLHPLKPRTLSHVGLGATSSDARGSYGNGRTVVFNLEITYTFGEMCSWHYNCFHLEVSINQFSRASTVNGALYELRSIWFDRNYDPFNAVFSLLSRKFI